MQGLGQTRFMRKILSGRSTAGRFLSEPLAARPCLSVKNPEIPLPLRTKHRLDGLETAYCGGFILERQIKIYHLIFSIVATHYGIEKEE